MCLGDLFIVNVIFIKEEICDEGTKPIIYTLDGSVSHILRIFGYKKVSDVVNCRANCLKGGRILM